MVLHIYITSYIWTPGFAVIVFKSPYGWLFKSIIEDNLMNTRIKLIDQYKNELFE